MTDLYKSIETLYSNRRNFVVIALTGRTGAGCTTAAEMLTRTTIDKIKLPKPLLLNDNEERKYRICHDFIKNNWSPFIWIQIKDIITSFILENNFEDFKKYVSYFLNNGKIRQEDIESVLENEIKAEYEKLHNIRMQIRQLRKKIEDSEVVDKAEVKRRREQSYKFYFNIVPAFTENLKRTLSQLSGETYTTFYQKAGDNIRSSGNALNEEYDSQNIHRLAIRVNKIIKIFTTRNRHSKEQVLVVIDAIRNPFEAVFFRERYSAFYLLSINTPEKDRIHRLKKILNLTDKQLQHIDEKEGPKKLNGSHFFFSQNIPSCIQLADIHINNPQEDNGDINTLKKQLVRYISLILQPGIISPSREERCMQLAHTAKLNSGCISRQVGAIITDKNSSVRGVGWNSSAEGQTPCLLRNSEDILNHEDKDAYSDYERNNLLFRNVLKELYLDGLENDKCKDRLNGRSISFCFKDVINLIEGEKNQVHTRSLHAEENAFLQIAKYGGQGIEGGKLFTTASPCELCAKKAYQLGIKEIYYIDPYPGISLDHILNIGNKNPLPYLFNGAIGRAYNQLYEPILPYKDELETILNS